MSELNPELLNQLSLDELTGLCLDVIKYSKLPDEPDGYFPPDSRLDLKDVVDLRAKRKAYEQLKTQYIGARALSKRRLGKSLQAAKALAEPPAGATPVFKVHRQFDSRWNASEIEPSDNISELFSIVNNALVYKTQSGGTVIIPGSQDFLYELREEVQIPEAGSDHGQIKQSREQLSVSQYEPNAYPFVMDSVLGPPPAELTQAKARQLILQTSQLPQSDRTLLGQELNDG